MTDENKIEEIGHKYGMDKETIEEVKKQMGAPSTRLNNFLERIERLEEEKTELIRDIREIYAEAKGQGFDTKVMRQIIRLRKMDPADRAETEYLRDEYKKLVGIND